MRDAVRWHGPHRFMVPCMREAKGGYLGNRSGRFLACIGTMNRSDSDRGRSPPAAVAQRRGRGWFSRGAGAGHTLRPGTGRGPLLRPGQLTGNGRFMDSTDAIFSPHWGHEPDLHKPLNDQWPSKSEARMSKCSELCGRRFRRYRHSSFGFENHGSWKDSPDLF